MLEKYGEDKWVGVSGGRGGGGGLGFGAGFWGWGRMFPPETEVDHNGFITKHKGVRHSAGGGRGGGDLNRLK